MTMDGYFLSSRLISLHSQRCAVSQHQTYRQYILWVEICSIRTIYSMVNSSPSAPVSKGSR